MRILWLFSITLLTITTWCHRTWGFCSYYQNNRQSIFSKSITFLRATNGGSNESSSSSEQPTTTTPSAATLLKIVEEIANDQFSPEVVAKMTELEKALTAFLEGEKVGNEKNKPSPRPPGIPPPLNMLNSEKERTEKGLSLHKAEEALEKLRLRLRQEEESLRIAEDALKKSLEEEEVLQRAEQALQKSREAAERRKAEAIRRTEAAVANAERARKEQEMAERNLDDDYDFDEDEQTAQRSTVAVDKPRATVSLDDLFGGGTSSSNEGDDGDHFFLSEDEVPSHIPILYNWIQYVDGSITGKVKGSRNFNDGATISTSPVPNGAKAGSVITTSSGSRYFLAKGTSGTEVENRKHAEDGRQRVIEEAQRKTADTIRKAQTSLPKLFNEAPEGVPSIVSWVLNEYGGISGRIFGSPNADDGDYIETSMVARGTIESGGVVETRSGSRYFLSAQKLDVTVNNNAWKDDLATVSSGGGRGTITITKETKQKQTDEAMTKLEAAKSRSTFSLLDLFGGGSQKQSIPPLPKGKKAPDGVPTLSRWSLNEDGTITGVISGSHNIDDGILVTTSPIVQGSKRRFETVTTVRGSVYYLG